MDLTKRLLCLFALSLGLVACSGGGGDGSQEVNPPPVAVACIPADASTHGECGTVLLGLTDDDGDFLN